MKSVLLAGGGTTGHVAPMLALADCLRRRDPQLRIEILGTAAGVESRLVPAAGYQMHLVPRVPLPRRPSVDLLRLPGRLTAAVGAAGEALETSQAQVLVGFGGYVSTPGFLAASRRGIPIVVHEGNARPGLANRLGARLTKHVAVTFPGTELPHAVLTGMPLRTQITSLDRAALREEAHRYFGLDPARPTLLVTGGSLGAARLNTTFGEAAQALVGAGIQVLHLCGRDKRVDLPAENLPGYVVREYLDRMDLAYAVASFVVCRSGAGTVCEMSVLGLPAVYVPLPIGNGEQRLNAAALVEAGGGQLLADADCTPDWVRGQLLPLLGDAAAVRAMGEAARGFGVSDGDERLADLVYQAAGEKS